MSGRFDPRLDARHDREERVGDRLLQSNADGGLLAPGTFIGTGLPGVGDQIPASGTGTRLMWYPAKAALRAR